MSRKLQDLRKELVPTVYPEDIAKLVGLRPNSYARIEEGRRTTYTRANKILEVLNTLRRERGLPELKLEDLDIGIA